MFLSESSFFGSPRALFSFSYLVFPSSSLHQSAHQSITASALLLIVVSSMTKPSRSSGRHSSGSESKKSLSLSVNLSGTPSKQTQQPFLVAATPEKKTRDVSPRSGRRHDKDLDETPVKVPLSTSKRTTTTTTKQTATEEAKRLVEQQRQAQPRLRALDDDGQPCLCAPATQGWVDPADKTKQDAVETILRQFDLNTKYGPCLGISRLARWERADRLGKQPPPNIKALIEENGTSTKYNQSIWEGRT